MKSEKLLEAIGEVKESYVLSALDSRNGKKKPKKKLSINRTLLIAAIVALMLLLVGCAVAYVLSLQEKKIGEIPGKRYFDEEGQRIPVTEVTQDVISLFGYSDSPAHLASKEWYEFRRSYDLDKELFPNDDTKLPFDDFYMDTYGCYTQEMVDKINEITRKYGLKLLGKSSTIQNWDTDIFFEATEITGLCHADAEAEINYGSGSLFPDGAFDLSMTITPTAKDSLWPHRVTATMYYTGKDYFYPLSTHILSESYEEWIYNVSDGTEVLIAMHKSGALIFAEQDDAYITITLTTSNNPFVTENDPKPSKEAIEQLVEMFDFCICPHVTDMDAVRAKLDTSWEAWTIQADEKNKPVHYQGGFAGYLKHTYTRLVPSIYYTFYDINADGIDDLLLGSEDGTLFSAMALHDGSVVDLQLSATFRLCEDGVIEGYSAMGTYASYGYYKLEGFDIQGRGAHIKLLEHLSYDSEENIFRYSNDGTDGSGTEVSKNTAQSIREKYVPVELEMKPLMGFPVEEDGTTLEEYIQANEVSISDTEQMAIYAKEVQKAISSEDGEYRFYCLWDINGDGVEDLLLAENESYFTDAITVYNGEPCILWHWTHFNLCENGIIKISSINNRADRYHFFTYDNNSEQKMVDYIEYNAAEDKWYRSSDGNYEIDQTITEKEASEILCSYIVIDPKLAPINEFPSTQTE